MATEITMPKLSDTMTEGRLVAWKKSIGDRVERGDIIAEVETDKATMELEAFAAGVLTEIRVKPGEMVPVGTVIGLVGEGGEPPVAAAASPSEAAPVPDNWQPPPESPPSEPMAAGDVPERLLEVPPDAGSAPEHLPPPVGDGEKASPLVRRLAREKGVDLREVKGSGPEGRILQEDLEGFLGKQVEEKVEVERKTLTPEMSSSPAGGGKQPLSRMRAAIARTVAEAWRTIPHFTVTVAVDMGEAEEVRRELKEAGSAVSINDLIVKASALALAKFPLANASWTADGIIFHDGINIGIAVSLADGLLVPVIGGCQSLTVKEIALRSRELAERARSGRISERELSGGTFTISNLGMYGVEEFMAVIHPPQGAILAVGAILDEAVVRDGQVTAGRRMRVTLSADHRLLDGAYAAKFLAELKHTLENPVTMLM
ncbi:dihydrolipoamide acetyltransferase family protein [Geomobilimonas luticola]|uniref:Dihydrolipoamide acetyltransferase component of pyruvate dehydrogenase complex n=1 Tax=Geomobilimonas luticola TaxID=1114878 RepID=A0ABS5SCY2_9BACT|nr:dihydrolipoamide acetyltransferase family protein [Geomobilimonas luticola]MBT0653241.1 2-oxo acid dehydrogenase subunit E2 [Geomobilimonas luticola]